MRILDALGQAREWTTLLERLPRALQDIYFSPEYAALHRFDQGTRALLFAYERGDGALWLYPFLLQPVEPIGPERVGEGWFDIETPYGYGGPLASDSDAGFLADAHAAFAEWCAASKVVAEFARLHPLICNERWMDSRAEVVYDRETVSLNLQGFDALSLEEVPFDKMTRYMLRRASNLEIEIEDAPSQASCAEFVRLYGMTMGRLGANDYYYFSEEYFEGLRRVVQKSGWLVWARAGAERVAAALFLKGETLLHYHLSASDPERRAPGATNRLIYEAARLGAKQGLEALHLGGGITGAEDDSLLKFKRRMGTRAHPFRTARRVHQPQIYERLREAWARAYPALAEKYGRRLLCYRTRI